MGTRKTESVSTLCQPERGWWAAVVARPQSWGPSSCLPLGQVGTATRVAGTTLTDLGWPSGPQGEKGEPRAILPSPGQWWSEKSNGKGHGVKGAGERPGGQRRRWGPLSACPSERGQDPAAPGHEPPVPAPPGPLASGGPPPDCRLGSLWPAVKLAPTSRGQRRLGAPRHVGPHPAICCSKAGPAPPFAGPRRR